MINESVADLNVMDYLREQKEGICDNKPIFIKTVTQKEVISIDYDIVRDCIDICTCSLK